VRRLELVVTVGHEHERRGHLDPAAEQAEHVEGRLVGPVQVFEHEHGRPRAELVEQGGYYLVRAGAPGDEARERLPGLLRDIRERTERPRGEKCVTRAGEHTYVSAQVRTKAPHEGGLADPGLTGEHDEPPASLLHLCQRCSEGVEKVVALEQPGGRNRAHRCIVRHPGGCCKRARR
jgi:hypothetical protein